MSAATALRRARVLRAYKPQYPDPIEFRAGESIQVGKRDTEWPEFVWATDPRGRSGWVHQDRLSAHAGLALATRGYSARELEAEAGARVQLLEEAGGWWWVEDERGRRGWLPAKTLSAEAGAKEDER